MLISFEELLLILQRLPANCDLKAGAGEFQELCLFSATVSVFHYVLIGVQRTDAESYAASIALRQQATSRDSRLKPRRIDVIRRDRELAAYENILRSRTGQ